jgi:hypothetical protein
MKIRNLLLIFAVGILFGAFAVSFFRAGRTVSSPEAAEKLEPPEPPPAPIAREPHAARPVAPAPPAPAKPDPLKTAEVEQPPFPLPKGPAKPFINEAQVSHSFDEERLERVECFSGDDISWMRLRWEDFEEERRALIDRTTSGEQKWDGGEWIELQRKLRETLGDAHYSALLYATGQANGIQVNTLPRGSRAAEAGVQRGDRVFSYGGEQVYERRALQVLAANQPSERPVEITVRHVDSTIETLWIEPGPLGVHLVVDKQSPCLDRGR